MDNTQLNPSVFYDQLEPNTVECIDPQFAILEASLLAHWEKKMVPDVLRYNSAQFLHQTVDCWWEIQIEACCIRNNLNRTNFHRTRPVEAPEDLVGLYERLKTVKVFYRPDDIQTVRELEPHEHQAISVLERALNYYEPLARAILFPRYREVPPGNGPMRS